MNSQNMGQNWMKEDKALEKYGWNVFISDLFVICEAITSHKGLF